MLVSTRQRRRAVTLRPDEIVSGFQQEMEAFGALVGGLDSTQWATPSRCEGWTVADVAAHAIGSVADVVAGRVEGLGSPEATAREVAERSGRSPAELADELAAVSKQISDLAVLFDDDAWAGPAPGDYDGTLAQGVEALFYDTWAHGDDIRAALGMASVTESPGLRAALHHLALVLAQQGWGPATLALDGVEEIEIAAPADGAAGGAGAGHRITGDPLAFVLVASGRAEPAALGLDETVNVYR
jgi:uncharacterized protein (TIGR03083 family)